MSHIAVLLLAVGAADLARPLRRRARWSPLAVGLVTLVGVALLAGLASGADVLILIGCAAATTGWVELSARAERRHRDELLPLTVLCGGVVVLLAVSGAGSTADGAVGRWLRWVDLPPLHDVAAEKFLLLLALALVQLSTGNELVRLVLAAVGALKPQGQPQPSDRLKGGRLLGPLERIFILGLGLAGEVASAGLVIAAKGLIRFPELNARRSLTQAQSEVGIDEVTEYFLVGSFVSWLVSLTALALAALA